MSILLTLSEKGRIMKFLCNVLLMNLISLTRERKDRVGTVLV
jgi:hypothetical protein